MVRKQLILCVINVQLFILNDNFDLIITSITQTHVKVITYLIVKCAQAQMGSAGAGSDNRPGPPRLKLANFAVASTRTVQLHRLARRRPAHAGRRPGRRARRHGDRGGRA